MTPNTVRLEIEEIEKSFRAQGYITQRISGAGVVVKPTEESIREVERYRQAVSLDLSNNTIADHLASR